MEKLKHFLLVLLLQLLLSVQLYSDSFYITNEQLTELENQSENQELLIQIQKEQLTELNDQLTEQEKQLIELEEQTDNLENQLEQAETSLKKSESKNWIKRILIAIGTFIIGVFTGGLFIYNHS